MKTISDIVLSFINVLEAEGKLLREKTIDAGRSVVYLFFGMLCVFVAFAVLAFALFAWLVPLYGECAAQLIIAGLFLFVGIIFLSKGGKK